MDSLSSSFNNIIQLSTKNNNTHHHLKSTPKLSFHVSSLKTNDRPQTTATKAPQPPPPPQQSPLASISLLPTTILNTFDNIINTFIDPPHKPSIDPRYVLSDNFAPVDELPPTPCQVIEGSLPPALDGAYIRNGPNPKFLPRGPYHLFDGDDMLHLITSLANPSLPLNSTIISSI
ncbi:carotenoid cleavage dioxygenase 4 [Castilleja foliolosa]|uniref:Carotenoid cleavage dioxygenase 4 n=1 Tax=Castilleja foliolosa TaxID=1961234 RepID=A0ABD3CIQ8_9LAMI